MTGFKVVTRAKLLAIATILKGKVLHLLIVLGVECAHHIGCGALNSAVILASHSASRTLTQISITSLNLSVDEIIVCEAKGCRFEITLLAIRVHCPAHIPWASCCQTMLLMMRAIASAIINELR